MWIIRNRKARGAPAASGAATPGSRNEASPREQPGDAAAPGARDDAAALRSIEKAIRRFLMAYVPEEPKGNDADDGSERPDRRRGVRKLAGNRNLWREVSSLTMLQLVAFVEQKFSIAVRPIDFAPQNFSTVAAIARFVAARRPPAADRVVVRPGGT